MSREERGLSTADLVSATEEPQVREAREVERGSPEPLAPDSVRAERVQSLDDREAEMRDMRDMRDVRDVEMRDGMRDGQMRDGEMRAGEMRNAEMRDAGAQAEAEPLAALFEPELSHDYRMQWSNVQIGFVDDPQRAVQKADELVAQVMKRLAESFARQRAEIEAVAGGSEPASTENLRLALRRYRSFFERLLTL